MKDQLFWLEDNGTIIYVGQEPEILDGLTLERKQRQRVGYIEPLSYSKRLWFRILRLVCGDSGRVAAWTRTWRGPWVLRVPGIGHMSVHLSRWVAVETEEQLVREMIDNN